MRYLILACVALLAGCGLLSPEQQSTALQVIDQMLASGVISTAQYEALREAILSSGQAIWWEQIATAVVGAGLGYLGVQIRRGPPTQKVGLPAAKVHPDGQ